MIWYAGLAILLAVFLCWPALRLPVFLAILMATYAGSAELMGRAKPQRLEWRRQESVRILAYKIEERRAIYLWLDRTSGPVAYRMPWSLEAAKALHRAFRENRRLGGRGVLGTRLFQHGRDTKPQFHPMPPLPLPPKGGSTT